MSPVHFAEAGVVSSKLERALIGHDDLENNPHLAELELVDVLLHVAGLAWCARWGTDGLISSPAQLKLLMRRHPDPDAGAMRLSATGIWGAVGSGWQLPWDGQITAVRAARIQKGNKQRWDRYREIEERCRTGDHSQCDDRKACPMNRRTHASNGVQNGVSNRKSNGVANARLFEPNLTGPDRTDPQGIGEGRSGTHRSGARLVEAAALTPPGSGRTERRELDPIDPLALVHALRATHVDNPAPVSPEQKTQLAQLLPSRLISAEDIVAVLKVALTFEGHQLRDINSGVGSAIIAAAEVLGVVGFPAQWVEAAAEIRVTRDVANVPGSQAAAQRAP